MATLTSQIQALLTYANGISGKADTTLGDAVKSLGDGFGGSSNIISGEVTPSSNTRSLSVSYNSDKTAIMALLICDELYTNMVGNSNINCIGFNKDVIDYSGSNAFNTITNSAGTSISISLCNITFAAGKIMFGSSTATVKNYIANKTYKYYIILN